MKSNYLKCFYVNEHFKNGKWNSKLDYTSLCVEERPINIEDKVTGEVCCLEFNILCAFYLILSRCSTDIYKRKEYSCAKCNDTDPMTHFINDTFHRHFVNCAINQFGVEWHHCDNLFGAKNNNKSNGFIPSCHVISFCKSKYRKFHYLCANDIN